MIKLNGRAFPGVGIADLQRGEKREYKYQLTTEGGRRRSELRARYRVYNVTLGSITQSDYDALRGALSTDAETVRVTLPDGQADVTFDAEAELGDDALGFIEDDGTRRWDGLTLTITGVDPLEDGQKTRCEIKYGLYDVTAKDDAALAASERQTWSGLAQLHDETRSIAPWATLEGGGIPLKGNRSLFPDQPEAQFMGLWSVSMSGGDGRFANMPMLTAAFTHPHTSMGVTLLFSASTGDWASGLTIRWYGADGGMLAAQDFFPGSAICFCEKLVENYYRLEITFHGTNKPHHFLKVTGLQYGVTEILTGSKLTAARVVEEVDPISDEISVNMLYFTFHSNGEFDLLDQSEKYKVFQQRQPVQVSGYMDGQDIPFGTYYANIPETCDGVVDVTCTDLIGVIDGTDYMGGLWQDGIAAGALIADIMLSAGVSDRYALAPELAGTTIKGYLPICSHRKALQQVAFALGAMVSCARSDKIRIFKTSLQPLRGVTPGDKVAGHTLQQRELVTGVEVYVHSYRQTGFYDEREELFKAQCPAGEQPVKFSAPADSLKCTGAQIIKQGINYAVLQVDTPGAVTLEGRVYKDQVSLSGSVYAANRSAGAAEKVIAIDSCTLHADPQALAQQIYDYYQQRIKDEGRLFPGAWQTGDRVTVSQNKGKPLTGILTAMETELTDGMIIKTEVTGSG